MLKYENKNGNPKGMAEGRLAPAPFESQEHYVSAPSSADFVFRGGHMQFQLDIDDQSDTKSIAPHDPLTELPYPIFYTRQDYIFRKKNYHHLRHPKKSRELGYDAHEDDSGEIRYKISQDSARRIEGKALRFSYGQLTPVYLHDRYHRLFSGSYLPPDRLGKFKGTVLSLAGVVPRTAIDLATPGEFHLRELSDAEFKFLSSRRRIFFEKARDSTPEEAAAKRDTIGQFFASYAIEQSLKLPPETFERFLHTKNEEVRRKLGREILNEAIGFSVANLVPVHDKAKAEGMTNSRSRSPGAIVRSFFPENRYPDYYPVLESTAKSALS